MKPLAAFAVAAAIVCITPAYAQQTNLTGDWTGGYVGQDGADANTFNVKLRQSGTAITGTITELNAIGDAEQVLFLTSTFQGRVNGGAVGVRGLFQGFGGLLANGVGRHEPEDDRKILFQIG